MIRGGFEMRTKIDKPKKGLRRALTAIMTAALCLSSTLPVLAGAGGLPGAGNGATAYLGKTLQYAENRGLDTPDAKFTFTFTKKELNGGTEQKDWDKMPEMPNQELNFSSADTKKIENGVVKVEKKTDELVENLAWTQTGVHVYTVVEKAEGFTPDTGETMTYSQASYDLQIVVMYDDASKTYYVERTFLNKTKADDGTDVDVTLGKGDPGNVDDTDFIFVNTFVTNGGIKGTTFNALEITNTIEGDAADPLKQFTYTIKMDDSKAVATPGGEYVGTILRADGTSENITVKANGTDFTFTLADIEKIEFETLPVGTIYSVTQTGEKGYKTSYTGATDGVEITNQEKLVLKDQTIGVEDNFVDFLNEYDNSLIPTGIITNNLPVVIMVGVIALAFVALAATNRRRSAR